MSVIRIVGGRLIDPSQNLDQKGDLWIVDGKIDAVQIGSGRGGSESIDLTIDASDMLVVPGLIDMHVHLRGAPGAGSGENVASGSRAALAGGFTGIACMPDTDPPMDNQGSAEFVTLQASRAGTIHVWPVGAVTKARQGQELAEMGGLVEGGAVAFSDSDRPIADAEIMRRALQYAQMFDKVVLNHPEVPELSRSGIMNEGFISMKLGMPAIPGAAEEIMVDRDLHLTGLTGGRLHLQNLSCRRSVDSVRRAKQNGIQVTAEVCPHHFMLTEEMLSSFDSVYKVNPPLRTSRDVEAMIHGLADDTLDVIASGHSPCSAEDKMHELDVAPFGMIGLETVLPVSITGLIEPGHLTWLQLISKLSTNPARILSIDRGTLQVGRPADITLIDPNASWTIDPSTFRSRSRNCPFAGMQVRGRAEIVLVDGEIRHSRQPQRESRG